MLEFLKHSHKLKNEDVLEGSHPVSKRLDIWLNELWEIMQIADPHVSLIPKPKILIINSDKSNAFVSPVFRCIPKTIKPRFRLLFQKGSGKIDYIRYDRKNNILYEFKATKLCLTGSDFKSLEEEEKTIKWLTSTSPECQSIRVDNCQYIISKKCAALYNRDKVYLEEGTNFVFTATANWITFYSGILHQKEEQVVSVLAHELAHYVMSHPTAPKGRYNFLYRIGDQNPAKRPVATRGISSDMLAKIGAAQKKIKNIPTIPNQKFSTLVYNNFRSPISTLSKPSCLPGVECTKACKDFKNFLINKGWELKSIYSTRLPQHKYPIYYEFETKAIACTKLMAFDKGWQSTFNRSLLSYVGITLPSIKATSLLEALDVFSREVPKIISEHNSQHLAVLQDAINNRIGYYTSEQEADEIALESMIRLGFKMETLANMLDHLYKKSGNEKSVFASLGRIAPDLCMSTIESGEYIPLTDYLDDHHDGCYRIYNIFREDAVHKSYYDSLNISRKLPVFEKSWEMMLTTLKK